MPMIQRIVLAVLLLAAVHSATAQAEDQNGSPALRIEIPVPLKESKVVFNMDHLAFAGDQSIGLSAMATVMRNYKAANAPIRIVAVFHGAAGYMVLSDAAYNSARKSWYGNPFKEQIKALQQDGVQFELCVNTAKNNGWVNADLLPGVKVNGGANVRLIQLMQDGYVQLHP